MIENTVTATHTSEPESSTIQKIMFKLNGWLKTAIPVVFVFIIFISLWQLICALFDIPKYLLPAPTDIFNSAVMNHERFFNSIWTTVLESVIGFSLSTVLGIGSAILLSLSKTIEKSIYPYAIVLQTIPIVAIAPIIVIWFGAGMNSIVTITFICSFFPILSNTLIGLNSTDHNMRNLFYLYNATRMQTVWKLRVPAALPYILAGLKVSCSLSVVGAIVGEYLAGIGGGAGGLGYAITVASARMETSYLFACGLAASVVGISFFLVVNFISKLMLRSWHESEMKRG